jgi:hypothetical protein
MAYIDPGAGGLLMQAIGGVLIALVATTARVRAFFRRLFKRDTPPS